MRRTLPVLALTVTTWQVIRAARADSDDDTLKRWLDRSDAVVDATVHGFGPAFYDELGVANYPVALQVHAMVKGRDLPPPPPEAWFGVQPYGPWLVRRLGELAKPAR